MSNFRLVILDYAKEQLDNPSAQKLLNDLIIVKQKNFERTDPDYVVVDKHDMIGTHALIYETSDLFEPRLIFALRLTLEDRAQRHKVKTPIQELIPLLDSKCQDAYAKFKQQHPILADCNSWFVDTDFSLKKSGLRLSDVGYAMIFLQIKRMGLDHMLGCTNEKYKAHRWLENIGSFQKGYDFVHPTVPDKHMFIMIEKFNIPYLKSVYIENKELFDSLVDVVPEKLNRPSIKQVIQETFGSDDIEKSNIIQLKFSDAEVKKAS